MKNINDVLNVLEEYKINTLNKKNKFLIAYPIITYLLILNYCFEFYRIIFKLLFKKILIEKEYPISVDYSLSIDEILMKAEIKEDLKISCIEEYYNTSSRQKKNVVIKLICLDDIISSSYDPSKHNLNHEYVKLTTREVYSELERKNLRPANIQELISLFIKYPHILKISDIIALGSRYANNSLKLDPSSHYSPFITYRGEAKTLSCKYLEVRFEKGEFLFAAVAAGNK